MSTPSFTRRSVAALAGGLLAATTAVAGTAIARTEPQAQAASPNVQDITERPTLVGSITDPAGDVKSSVFSPAVLASVDVKSTKVYSGLDIADHEVVIETQLAGAVKAAKVARAWTATLTWRDAEGASHKAVLRSGRTAQGATTETLLIDGKPNDCAADTGVEGSRVYHILHGSCLSATPEPYRVVVNTVASSGKTKVADATKISTLKPTPAPVLRAWTWNETENDNTAGASPADFAGAADIVEAKVLGGHGKPSRVEATLVDAAFYPWDVAQTYTLNITTGEPGGSPTASFSAQAPRTGEAGTFTLAGSGYLQGCEATASTTRTEKLSITLPADCATLPRVAKLELVVDASGEDGSKAKAQDRTNTSGPLLLR